MKKVGLLLVVLFSLVLVLGPVLATRPQAPRNLVGARLATLQYKEVSFANAAQDLDLAGMLFIPNGHGPFPAAVMIHGAGDSQRDNPWYLTLAAYLQENGILVLLPDKRGSVRSEGNWRTSSFADLATDAVAAVDFLKTQTLVDVSEIGIIGMSQGGQLSPLVAAQSPDVAFLIDVVGTSLSLYDVLHYEETQNLRQMGFLPGVSDLLAYPTTFVLQEFRQKEFWNAVGNFDPLPYWQALTIPALVMYGSEDPNVPAEKSKARLDALRQENITVNVYAGSAHALEDPVGTGSRIFRPEALQDIKEFIYAVAPPSIAFALPSFTFQGDDPALPIVTHDPSPDIQNRYINPGAVLFHQDQFHMFFNSFTGWPGVLQVGYMTSADGYHWQMAQAAPVFTTDHIPFGGGHADVSAAVILPDGRWALYFHTITGGEIGRLTAPSPLGPWVADAAPVLRPGPAGEWDQYWLGWPSIVQEGGNFRLYYGARTRDGYAIGLATSADGLTWTKYNDSATVGEPFAYSDPVLVAGADWELTKVDRPRVVKTPDGWVMLYQGGPAIEARGLALSRDGLHWQKYPANPIFHRDVFPIPNAKTWDANLLYHEGAYYYYLELGSLSGTNLYLAAHHGSLLRK